MSSKKFVYLLMMVAIVCGFVAGDTAHGQSTTAFVIEGTILKSDGTPADGNLEVKAVGFIGSVRADGTYNLAFVGNPFLP